MEFMIGCNYWASNAGTEMWNNWSEDAVREDLEILSAHGVRYMRAFPNWRDFQPVIPMLKKIGYCLTDDRIPTNPYYLDDIMLERFDRFCDLCEEYGMKLIISLMTGFMSGRQFIPSALYGKDLLTDPVALSFEQLYLKGMVRRFKNRKVIIAWGLGNECNTWGGGDNRYTGMNWTALISNAIRAEDPTRPIYSDMHGLALPHEKYGWKIEDQGEFCDVMTTHPYPLWVNHVFMDHMTSYRNLINTTAQTKYYADIAKKPCCVGETGTMGPMVCSEELAGKYAKTNLLSAWANGATGFLWWCANEQIDLETDPYTRIMVETELGLIDRYRKPKPVLKTYKEITDLLASLPFTLPKAKEDAVCVLTRGQDSWGAAYMTYALGKQAGLNLKYAYSEDSLPDADLYIVPSVAGTGGVMTRRPYKELQKRVAEGATLYLSMDDGFLSEFKEFFGLEVTDSGKYADKATVTFEGVTYPFTRPKRYETRSVGAKVLAEDSLGFPAISEFAYGKGKVYFVNFPLETMLLNQHEVFDGPYHNLYRSLFKEKLQQLEVTTENSYVGITLHPAEDGTLYCVAINYSDKEQAMNLKIKDGLKIDTVYYGDAETLAPFGALICALK